MEFIIGNDKFPLIKFEDNKYSHIFPVTKYQFERYIWETAPGIDYDTIVFPRVSPDEINKKNLKHLFVTNITFKEATEYANWLEGRLPAKDEIEKIYFYISENIKEIYNLPNLLKNETSIDRRFFVIINKLKQNGIENFMQISEFCREYITVDGRIYIKKFNCSFSEIVGPSPLEFRNKDCGFRVIKTVGED
jgi:hypothetical protein